METITFTYNEQDTQAKNLLNYILASGLLVPKIEKESGLSQAFEDIKKGRVYIMPSEGAKMERKKPCKLTDREFFVKIENPKYDLDYTHTFKKYAPHPLTGFPQKGKDKVMECHISA